MVTDGCTFWFNGDWRKCCDRHDKRYATGKLTRLQADILLKRCVAKKNKPMSLIMFIGVRLFGWLRYKG